MGVDGSACAPVCEPSGELAIFSGADALALSYNMSTLVDHPSRLFRRQSLVEMRKRCRSTPKAAYALVLTHIHMLDHESHHSKREQRPLLLLRSSPLGDGLVP
jgi:hypothetical protein